MLGKLLLVRVASNELPFSFRGVFGWEIQVGGSLCGHSLEGEDLERYLSLVFRVVGQG